MAAQEQQSITRGGRFSRLTASPYFFPERVVNQLACLVSPSTAAHHVGLAGRRGLSATRKRRFSAEAARWALALTELLVRSGWAGLNGLAQGVTVKRIGRLFRAGSVNCQKAVTPFLQHADKGPVQSRTDQFDKGNPLPSCHLVWCNSSSFTLTHLWQAPNC